MTDSVFAPSKSSVDQNIYKVFPNDLNSHHTIFGGVVMSLCDRTALVVAERHSGSVCVTAGVDHFNFVAPAKQGDTLVVQASINRSWKSSMEIGVRVSAENSFTQVRSHIVSAYFTFVALSDAGKPVHVHKVSPETDIEERRYAEADVRRNARLKIRESIKELRAK